MSYLGLDLARSAMRWHLSPAENGYPDEDVLYRLSGCPQSLEYDSSEKWGAPLALRKHVFKENIPGPELVEKTANLIFPSGCDFGWLRSILSHPQLPFHNTINCVAAAAVPDHAPPEQLDSVFDILSEKFTNPYILWRSIAMVLAWMDSLRKTGRDCTSLLDRQVITVDLDGGPPELSIISFRRHMQHNNHILPVRTTPQQNTILSNNNFEEESYAAILGHIREYRQLLDGQFASEIQKAIEEGEYEKDAWIRTCGAWRKERIKLPLEMARNEIWGLLDPLFNNIHYRNQSTILIFNGWIARRFERQLRTIFDKQGVELAVLPPFSIAHGCSLFAEQLSKGEPTYYDQIPDYRIWDGKEAAFQSLFQDRNCKEPGLNYQDNGNRRYEIERFNDNVSVYVQLRPDNQTPSGDDFAHRLKVNFHGFIQEPVTVRLKSTIQIARGAARFTFTMEDKNAQPIFLVNQKPAREITLRYSIHQDPLHGSDVTIEPEHKGFPEPQPVLGRIYDHPKNGLDNFQMLKAFLENPVGYKFKALFQSFQARFYEDAHFFTSRVGYSAHPREPTRGLFGTKWIANQEIDKLVAEYAMRCWNDRTTVCSHGNEFLPQCVNNRYLDCVTNCWLNRLNLCHSIAPDAYKNAIRCFLRERREFFTWNFYHAPGYVLGDHEGDLDLLLRYMLQRPADPDKTPKLWWSVFRMLCWHPMARTGDLDLLAKCLEKLCNEDAQTCSDNDKKFLVLAILFCLRIRESGQDLPHNLKENLCALLGAGVLRGVAFPKTMVHHLDQVNQKEDDTLSAYTIRFINKQDDLHDRELGACFGEV